MRKRTVLFVITSFRQGGISRSLQNLLSFMDQAKYGIDVYAMEDFGPYKSLLPNCSVLKSYIGLHAYVGKFKDMSMKVKPLAAMLKVLRNLSAMLGLDFNSWILRYYIQHIEKQKKYDTIVAFSEGVVTRFVSHAECDNKVAWIHCDYASYFALNAQRSELNIYSEYHHVVNVSNYTKESFLAIYPTLFKRTISIYNILDSNMMRVKALESIGDFQNDEFTLVSIGRLDPVKNMSAIPAIAKQLREYGAVFRWYIIGPVGCEEELQKLNQNIHANNVGEYVLYIGSQDNPYKYIKNSNVLVNVSLSEACPYVINEAKILHKPVVCSNFGSATEFIDNGVNGCIVNFDEMSKTILTLINDQEEYKRLSDNLIAFEYNNSAILQQVDNIL